MGNDTAPESELDILSDREVEVVSLLSQGANSSLICREMQIDEEDLRRLKSSIRSKCKLKDEVALIQFAARQRRTGN